MTARAEKISLPTSMCVISFADIWADKKLDDRPNSRSKLQTLELAIKSEFLRLFEEVLLRTCHHVAYDLHGSPMGQTITAVP